jgi:hypothetical protein
MAANDNVSRLVEAGVLDDKNLTDDDRTKINSIELSEDEISTLARIRQELGLKKLEWSDLGPYGMNYL